MQPHHAAEPTQRTHTAHTHSAHTTKRGRAFPHLLLPRHKYTPSQTEARHDVSALPGATVRCNMSTDMHVRSGGDTLAHASTRRVHCWQRQTLRACEQHSCDSTQACATTVLRCDCSVAPATHVRATHSSREWHRLPRLSAPSPGGTQAPRRAPRVIASDVTPWRAWWATRNTHTWSVCETHTAYSVRHARTVVPALPQGLPLGQRSYSRRGAAAALTRAAPSVI